MATPVALTGDLRDVLGQDFEPRSAVVTITTNLPKGAGVRDKTRKILHLPGGRIPVANDGTFTVDLIPTNAPDLDVSGLQYRVEVSATQLGGGDSRRGGKLTWDSGFFDFTGAANIADLDLDVPTLTAAWRSTYKTSVETAVNATAAARISEVNAAGTSAKAAIQADKTQVAADRAYVEDLVVTDLGTTDGQTKALIESPTSETAGALSAAYAKSAGRLMRPGDAEKIQSLLRSGRGIRYAAIGDSTEAGVGNGGGTYGEANSLLAFAGPTVLALALMRSDPNFVEPDPNISPVSTTAWGPGIPTHDLQVANSPSITYPARPQATPNPLAELTIYYVARTSDRSPTFDLTVNGVTTTVDAYLPKITYTTPELPVGGVLAKVTVACPASAAVTWKIDNLQVSNRGVGDANGNGTLWILGATRGKGVEFKNLAVSSTTLLNNSTANITRGITTDERFTKALAMSPDLVSIGFATNDSKPGVSSVSAFKADLAARIAQVRAARPRAVILLTTDPPGLAAPYDGNPAFNQAVRDVAAAEGVSCLDVEAVMAGMGEFYADDVHPNGPGYQAIGAATATAFGVGSGFAPARLTAKQAAPGVLTPSEVILTAAANPTESWVEVGSVQINNPWGSGVGLVLESYAKLTFASSADIPAAAARLVVAGYTGANLGGSLIGSNVVDLDTGSAFATGSVIRMVKIILRRLSVGSAASYRVSVEAKNNPATRVTDAQNRLTVRVTT